MSQPRGFGVGDVVHRETRPNPERSPIAPTHRISGPTAARGIMTLALATILVGAIASSEAGAGLELGLLPTRSLPALAASRLLRQGGVESVDWTGKRPIGMLIMPEGPWTTPPVDEPAGPWCMGLSCGTPMPPDESREGDPKPVLCAGLSCGTPIPADPPATGSPQNGPPAWLGINPPGSEGATGQWLVEPTTQGGGATTPPDSCAGMSCTGQPSLPPGPPAPPSAAPGDNLLTRDGTPMLPGSAPQTPEPSAPFDPYQWRSDAACTNPALAQGPGAPPSTSNPVDYATGQKLEGATDLIVPLPGRDFTLARSYTSRTDSEIPNLVGHGWQLNVSQFAQPDGAWPALAESDPINEPDAILIGTPMGLTRYQIEGSGPYMWRPAGPSDQYVTRATVTIDNVRYPVWRLTDPGSHTQDYLRLNEWNENGTETPLSGEESWATVDEEGSTGCMPGLPLQIRDIWGNVRTFAYARQSSGEEESLRLQYIYLGGTAASSLATVHFMWEATQADTVGLLRGVEVTRHIGTSDIAVAKVDYAYVGDGDLSGAHSDVGTDGDLAQVTVWQPVDGSEGTMVEDLWHPTVTQYRYHTTSDTHAWHDDSVAALDVGLQGMSHQLKAVIRPTQIEYGAQAAGAASVPAFAVQILAAGDDAEVTTGGFRPNQLASKVISEYETTGDHRVLKQYVMTSCGCGSGATSHGQQLSYAYHAWDPSGTPVPGEICRQLVVTEGIWDGTSWDQRRTQYFDLGHFQQTVDSEVKHYYLLTHNVVMVNDGAADRFWVTKNVYNSAGSGDATKRELIERRGPDCFSDYDCGTDGDEGDRPHTTDAGSGAYLAYTYDANHRLTTTSVKLLSDSSSSLISRVTYGSSGDYERPWLPKRIESVREAGHGITDLATGNQENVFVVEYEYAAFEGDAPRQVTLKAEKDLVAENGDSDGNDMTETVMLYDNLGRERWIRYPSGALSYREYDDSTGAVTLAVGNADGPPPSSYGWSVSSGWDGTNPDGGSLTWAFEYDAAGRLRKSIAPSGVTQRYVRELRGLSDLGGSLLADGRPGLPYFAVVALPQVIDAEEPTFAGPANVTWMNAAGAAIASCDYTLVAGDDYEEIAAYPFALDAMRSRQTVQQDVSGRVVTRTVWHSLSGQGENGGHYQTSYAYDDEGRISVVTAPNGTKSETRYDAVGRVHETWTGVGSSMALVASYDYDNQTSTALTVGRSHLTKVSLHTGESSPEPTRRETEYVYDERGRLAKVIQSASDVPDTLISHDNLGRIRKVATYTSLPSGTGDSAIATSANRLSLAETLYSQRGFPYQTRVAIKATDSDSSTVGYLCSFSWHDEMGRSVAEWGANGPATKYGYDAIGRMVTSWITDRGGDAAPGATGNLADAKALAGDVVYERSTLGYEQHTESSGEVSNSLLEITSHTVRAHGNADTVTGDFGSGGGPTGITTYATIGYDLASRPIRYSSFGTNLVTGFDSTGAAAPYKHAASPPYWTSESTGSGGVTPLETEIEFDPLGRATIVRSPWEGTPSQIVTKTFYDDMGRRIAVAENWSDADIEWATDVDGDDRWRVTGQHADHPDVDRVTSTVYRLTATPPAIDQVVHHAKSGTTESVQVTRYEFGVTAGTTSKITSNDLLGAIRYPDRATGSGEGLPSATDKVVMGYNRLGELRYRLDQLGVEHTYTFDAAGRLLKDAAAGGSDVDEWIDSIQLAYQGGTGRLSTVKSYDGTTVKNAVQVLYSNDVSSPTETLGFLRDFLQDPDGDITVDGSGNPTGTTARVRYHHSIAKCDGSGTANNYARPSSITYPNGDSLTVQYAPTGTGSGYRDSAISRVRRLSFGGYDAVQYSYMGLASPVVVDYPRPDIQLDASFAHDGNASTTGYPAMDTFGRLNRILWKDGNFGDNTSSASEPNVPPLVELAYTHDRLSNITSKTDARTGANRKRDYQYTVDGLMRLLTARRGEAGSSFADAPGGQRFGYDFLGNLKGFDTDVSGNGAFTDSTDSLRAGSFNAVNEQANYVETLSGGSSTFGMGADAAGNMTYRETVAGGNRLTYKHDRWGRLTEVWFSNGTPSGDPNRAIYRYNGLSMRCLVERDSNTTDGTHALNERRALYYGAGWQVLEERVDADKDDDYDRLAQNVWGLRYIDDLVLRRANANWNAGEDTDFADAGDTDWEQFLNDHQFSVVAGVNRVGTLTFRLAYDAYGEARHSWAKDIDGDGDVDAADGTIASAASGKQIHQSGYNADADWNRDGTVDSTDVTAFGMGSYATALASGQIASRTSDLTVGFCGYRFNGELGAYTVRFRHYDPTPGVARWLERDPAGYADGPSLYGYLGRAPTKGVDPFGLQILDGDEIGSPGNWSSRVDRESGERFLDAVGTVVSHKVTIGAFGLAGAVLSAPASLPALAIALVVIAVSSDQVTTGFAEIEQGRELDTRLHTELANLMGEENARLVEAGIAGAETGYGVYQLTKAGWRFLRYAPGKRPGGFSDLDVLRTMSTGRQPATLAEQLAMEAAKRHPDGGIIMNNITIEDTRIPPGWVKYRQRINDVEVHYLRDQATGECVDWKIK